MARKIAKALIADAARMVRNGATLIEAATTIGCTADMLSLKLRDLGIDTRAGSRIGFTQAARKARFENMQKAALDPRINNPAVGVGERELACLLTDAGFQIEQQKLVNGYVIDIALENIAIEIKGGKRYNIEASVMRTKRAHDLIECGYGFVFVMLQSMTAFRRHTHDLIGAIEKIRRSPPIGREYWMIRCCSYDVGTDHEADEWAIVKCSVKPLHTKP